jgi:HemY protein
MRFGLWTLLCLFVGAFAAHFLLEDRGYVMVNFRGYLVEMSVPALVLVLIGAYATVRGLIYLWHWPRRLGEAFAGLRARGAGKRLTRGVMHVVEGEWSKGERLLTQRLRESDSALANYLLAARAAQLQGAPQRRDEWLKLAYEEVPEAEVAVLLTQAELQLGEGELERAVATLRRVDESQPNHPMALALLARAYHALGDWDGLGKLLPRLGAARIEDTALVSLAADVLERDLARADLTADKLAAVWSDLPAKARRAPTLLRLRALALNRLGRGQEAERELRTALRREWDQHLVQTYGEVKGADVGKQLRQAESWLTSHPEDGVLLATAARLCMANELWGKARSYLESSLALSPSPATYALYARLLTRLGEEENAALAYRSGLGLIVKGSDLPALGPPERPWRAPETPTGTG